MGTRNHVRSYRSIIENKKHEKMKIFYLNPYFMRTHYKTNRCIHVQNGAIDSYQH